MPGASRVLVADSEDQVRRFLKEALALSGYSVDLLPGGRDVLDGYSPGVHGLLVLDSRISSGTGFEIISLLRDRGDDVPIVLMSGAARGAGRVAPFALAYRVELLRKPFGLSDLRAALGRATGTGELP
jgi:DNA-binding response OmpR family regulator